MRQPKYRAAVIGRTGKGDYGHGLDVALMGHPQLELVAVADEDPDGRARAAARLGVDRAYGDYREMIDREEPQVVSVAPRWVDCHREMILACVGRGIHVFCEKPMVADLAACDAIVDACERTHAKLAMAFQTRYSPRFDRVRELVAAGAIGEVLEVRGRGKEDQRGGGEDLMVLGSHIMDLFRGLLGPASWCFARVTENGRPITRDSARPGNEGLGPLAGDRVDAMYGFEGSPAVAHFATTRPADRAGSNRRFAVQVLGSKGIIELGFGWLPPTFLSDDPSWTGAGKPSSWTPITSAGLGKPEPRGGEGMDVANRAIVADLLRAIESDAQPRASVYDGRASVEMILACYASQLRGAPVALPMEDRSRHPLDPA